MMMNIVMMIHIVDDRTSIMMMMMMMKPGLMVQAIIGIRNQGRAGQTPDWDDHNDV